jgi:hypothetical protein
MNRFFLNLKVQTVSPDLFSSELFFETILDVNKECSKYGVMTNKFFRVTRIVSGKLFELHKIYPEE